MDRNEDGDRIKVALPVETKVRELDGKLWLGQNLVEEGHTVVIGGYQELREHLVRIAPDVFFETSAVLRKARLKACRLMRAMGGSVAVLDTEGGVYQSDEDFATRFSEDILDLVDHIFAWGPAPAKVATDFASYPKERISVTGNPRFDLLREPLRDIFQPEADRLREEHGEYVLFNTNFTRANHFDTRIQDASSREPRTDAEAYQAKLFDHFIEAIRAIAKEHPTLTVVIRPHPSERHEAYEEELNQPNIRVRHEGHVAHWILGSSLVVHNSCTTGIEAFMLDTPVIAYRPVADDRFDLPLPNQVSNEIDNLDELLSTVSTLTRELHPVEPNPEALKHLQEYILMPETLTAPMMAKAVTASINPRTSGPSTLESKLLLARRHLSYLTRYIPEPISPFEASSDPTTQHNRQYRHQKFPGLTLAEVEDRLDKLVHLSGLERPNVDPVPRSKTLYELS